MTTEGRVLRLGWARKPGAAARTDLVSCRLRNCTFGKLKLGKITLKNLPRGKTPLEKSNIVPKTQFLNNMNKNPENVYFREDMMKKSAAFCI